MRRITGAISAEGAVNAILYLSKGGLAELLLDEAKIAPQLAHVRHRQGRLIGRMEGLGCQFKAEAILQTLTEDVIKSSVLSGVEH